MALRADLQSTWRYVYATFGGRLNRQDCWDLCQGPHRCCRPGQVLQLMPGEGEFLRSEGVRILSPSSLMCYGRGDCYGNLRPMCCRTFPVHPDGDDGFLVYSGCSQHPWMSTHFTRGATMAWRRLLRHQEIQEWVTWARRDVWPHWPEREIRLDEIRREFGPGYTGTFRRYHGVAIRKALIMEQAVRPGERMLDVGCASGEGVQWLRDRGVKAWGLDVNPEYQGGFCITGDARAIPFAENSFTLAMSADLLEHLDEYGLVLEEMARVATDRLLLAVTPRENPYNFFEDPTHRVCLPWEEWKQEFRRVGRVAATSTWPWSALVEL